MGSKSRLAKYIVPIIQEEIDKSGVTTYIEPFVGGANVIDKIRCERRIGFDVSRPLISLLQYVQNGGVLPKLDKAGYDEIRNNRERFSNWEIGNAGYVHAYRGKFFGGFTSDRSKGSRSDQQRMNLQRQAEHFLDIDFACADYRNLSFRNCVIYCDPPYSGATGYGGKFNSEEFWEIARGWSESNIVFVSERFAPFDFVSVWDKPIRYEMAHDKKVEATEHLFMRKPS